MPAASICLSDKAMTHSGAVIGAAIATLFV
jgi:hypothetical protein